MHLNYPFIRSALLHKIKDHLGETVHQCEGIKFGVEVEMEGFNLPTIYDNRWMTKPDGSLQGGLEYVFNGPVNLHSTKTRLDYLETKLKEQDTNIVNSVRCSTHVHVNVQHLTYLQTLTAMAAYSCLENLLVAWCGEDRVGNLFCLRQSDAKFLPMEIRNKIFAGSISFGDAVRYSSMNLTSLNNFGSLEFRSMRGLDSHDVSDIKTWIDILNSVITSSLDFNNPGQIIGCMSGNGPENFLEVLVKDPRLIEELKTIPRYRSLIIESVRATQIWAMCIDWDKALDPNSKDETPHKNTRGERVFYNSLVVGERPSLNLQVFDDVVEEMTEDSFDDEHD